MSRRITFKVRAEDMVAGAEIVITVVKTKPGPRGPWKQGILPTQYTPLAPLETLEPLVDLGTADVWKGYPAKVMEIA